MALIWPVWLGFGANFNTLDNSMEMRASSKALHAVIKQPSLLCRLSRPVIKALANMVKLTVALSQVLHLFLRLAGEAVEPSSMART
jgi:hypothetical protein